MTNEQTTTLVLKDATASYFLVPKAVLEQCRVPAEHAAKLEQLIAAGDLNGEDVQGYFALGDTLVELPTGLQYHQRMIEILERIQDEVGGRTR